MLAMIENVKLKRSFTLNLSNYDLAEIPELVFTFNHDLLRFFLHNNKLGQLPVELFLLYNLHTLSLDFNNIPVLPPEICQLKNLVNLNVSSNPLKQLPPEICLISRLEVLWCNSTQLTELPEEIGYLKYLDTFGARNNQIKELPASIVELSNLRWLTLENNIIEELPPNFSNMHKLIHFNLSNNRLTSFPKDLTKMFSLQYVFMKNNLIDTIDANDMKYLYHLRMLSMKDNPVVNCCELKNFPFICLHSDWESPQSDTGVVSESSDDCWEHSIPTSEIDSTEESEGEWEDEEILVQMLPNISRFAAIG